MRFFRGACLLMIGFALACSWGACSAVPDVVFADVDGATDARADVAALDGGGRDAADQAAPSSACPGNPPPDGICCGSSICVGCATTDCGECNKTTCGAAEHCCKRGVNIQCRTLDNCK